MGESPRQRRLAERIQQVVAQVLERRVKDPRLGFVTVTEVRVTGDLQHATVFYTVLGDDDARDDTAAALASAKGLLRSEVGKATGLRLTPSLDFILDQLPEGASRIDDALREAAARDAELASKAHGASYAGDEDPYKRPVEPDEDLDQRPAAPSEGEA
ncbi:MAG: 30S ribosome-binding factor RbfA [Micrococcales bacterium]|nr:30S ribosome-binding factor RbfA [Micrococcales bacterium]